MERWYEEAESNALLGAKMYLVGSKSDKVGARVVKEEEGRELAERHGNGFCEVSAKTRENVRRPFVEIVDSIVGDKELLASGQRRGTGSVALGGSQGVGGGCSC